MDAAPEQPRAQQGRGQRRVVQQTPEAFDGVQQARLMGALLGGGGQHQGVVGARMDGRDTPPADATGGSSRSCVEPHFTLWVNSREYSYLTCVPWLGYTAFRFWTQATT